MVQGLIPAPPMPRRSDDAPLSLEQRVEQLERQFGRVVLSATNAALAAVGQSDVAPGAALQAAAGSLRALERLVEPIAPHEQLSLAALERRIAYDAARTDIECSCVAVGELPQGLAWDLHTFTMDGCLGFEQGEAEARVSRASRFLELIGQLGRLPGAPNIVFIKDLP